MITLINKWPNASSEIMYIQPLTMIYHHVLDSSHDYSYNLHDKKSHGSNKNNQN